MPSSPRLSYINPKPSVISILAFTPLTTSSLNRTDLSKMTSFVLIQTLIWQEKSGTYLSQSTLSMFLGGFYHQ